MPSAFLVLAHRAPGLCRRLLEKLSRFGDVFLHVDLKSQASAFSLPAAEAPPGMLRLATRRHHVRWGSFAMVQATLDLLEDARAVRDYDRYTLISGDSYPIKGADRIREFLASPHDHISAGDASRDERRVRIERIYVPDTLIGQIKAPFHERFLLPEDMEQLAEAARLFEQRAAFVERTGYHIGSQWWSLTGRSVGSLLRYVSETPDFTRNFRFSSIPDEAFFQTAFMASVENASRRLPGPVHSKWDSHPRPYEFGRPSDMALLDKAKEMFARKFAEDSDALLDALDARCA
jgi:hypothetical protein